MGKSSETSTEYHDQRQTAGDQAKQARKGHIVDGIMLGNKAQLGGNQLGKISGKNNTITIGDPAALGQMTDLAKLLAKSSSEATAATAATAASTADQFTTAIKDLSLSQQSAGFSETQQTTVKLAALGLGGLGLVALALWIVSKIVKR